MRVLTSVLLYSTASSQWDGSKHFTETVVQSSPILTSLGKFSLAAMTCYTGIHLVVAQ